MLVFLVGGTAIAVFGADDISRANDYYRQGKECYDRGEYLRANEAFKKAQEILGEDDGAVKAAGAAAVPVISLATSALPATPVIPATPIAAAGAPGTVVGMTTEQSAQLAYGSGDFKGAIQLYRQTLLRNPGNKDLKYNLALACLGAGYYEDAANILKSLLRANPEDTDICYNLGVLYESLLPDYDQALAYYRQYLKYAGETPRAKEVKAWVEYVTRQVN